MTQVLEQQIKSLVRKTVKETLHAELMHLRAGTLPLVTKEELTDITRRYKKPAHRTGRTIRANL